MSGGMFATALFVGGMTGGLVGQLARRIFPSVVAEPGGYVMVGMAAFFAGIAKAPIDPLGHGLRTDPRLRAVAPLMLASAISLVVGRDVRLYENQVDNKFRSQPTSVMRPSISWSGSRCRSLSAEPGDHVEAGAISGR